FVAMHGALGLFFSSFIKRPGIASASLLGTVVAGNGIAGQVAAADFPGARFFALLAPDQHPRIIRDSLFDRTGDFPALTAGFDVWASVAFIVVTTVLAGWFIYT